MRNSRGFTLLELLVVVVLTGLVAAICIALLPVPKRTGCGATCRDNLRQIHMCLVMYEQSEGMFPTRAQGTAIQYTSGDAQEALNLLYRQYTDDLRIFACSSKPLSVTMMSQILPSTAAGWPSAPGSSFKEAPPGTVGTSTSYGYSPGHNSNQLRVVVLADRQGTGPNGNSDNHGKDAGQNVLDAEGVVSFRTDKTNRIGMNKSGAVVFDSDIFQYNTITPSEYVDWDSVCR